MRTKVDSRPKKAASVRSRPIAVMDVMEWIRERIRRGRFVPGQRLIEVDIMRELSASRGRVREALQRLSSEGLLITEEFRGASVKALSRDEMLQMYRVRMALEALAARDFAASDAKDLKRRLVRVQSELDDVERTADHERFATLNEEWHGVIIEGSGNKYARQFVDTLCIPIYRFVSSATYYNARRIEEANARHRRVTEAILQGRADAAERLMLACSRYRMKNRLEACKLDDILE